MKKKDKDFLTFSRRSIVIGAFQGVALTGLAGRMAWLQVVEGEKYKTLADKNRINVRLLAPERGVIVDRYGSMLAKNDPNFRAFIIPEQTRDIENALLNLSEYIEIPEHDFKRVIKESRHKPVYVPVEIRNNLSWEEISRIQVNAPDLSGITTNVGTRRSYPLAESTAHLVGYVGAVSESDKGRSHLLSLPGFKIGKSGIEKKYDDDLRGKPGHLEVEVNVNGREVRELNRTPAAPGQRVVLNVDAKLQSFTQSQLSKKRSASAVIVDARNGEVYAIASSPAFDPNIFTLGLSPHEWEKLLSNPAHPLTNKAISGQYPPGSTFKMITALAALEKNIINENTTFHCPGHFQLGRDKFHCWRDEGHGNVNLHKSLVESCDVYYYNLATKVGVDNIAEMARRFGLGDVLGIELEAERPGLVPDKLWKRGYTGRSWQLGETVVTSIGQGYLQATPLQLAIMTARIINGGKAVLPSVTSGIGDEALKTKKINDMKVNSYHLRLIKRAMDDVIMGERGTARGSRIYKKGFEMGGKTGTSQVRRITKQERAQGIENEDMPWRMRHHALFVGYAPINDPRYVCSVVVEHGGGGASAAAPIAKNLLLETQKRDPAGKSIILDALSIKGQTNLAGQNSHYGEKKEE